MPKIPTYNQYLCKIYGKLQEVMRPGPKALGQNTPENKKPGRKRYLTASDPVLTDQVLIKTILLQLYAGAG